MRGTATGVRGTATGVLAEQIAKAANLVSVAKKFQASTNLAALVPTGADLLDIDVPAAEAAVKYAREAGVPAEEVDSAATIVSEAKKAQAKVLLEATVAAGPLEMDVAAVEAAIVVAEAAGLDAALITKAKTMLIEAKLAATVAFPPLEMPVPAAEAAV